MTLKISKLAFLEIEDAKEYYNLQKATLGDTFKSDVKKSIERCLLHRFPYSIFYAISDDTILVLSVAHQHRKPFYL